MGLKVLELRSCCWCVCLRTGCKLFGFISLVGCTFIAFVSAMEISMVARHDHEYFEQALFEISVDIFLQLTQMVSCVYLILGAYQEKAASLIPWLVTSIIVAIWESLFTPSIFHRTFELPNITPAVEWILATLMSIFVNVYGWLVVYSYYRTLSPQHGDVV